MVFTILSFVAIALEMVIIATLIAGKIKGKQIVSMESAVYVIPTFFIVYGLNCMGIVNDAITTGEPPSVFTFIQAIVASYELFGADVSLDFVSNLLTADVVFFIAYLIGVILSLLTFILFILATIRFFFRNNFSQKKMLANGCDILIGNSPENAVYIANHPNTLVWADESFSSEDAKQLFNDKVVHIKRSFNEKELVKLLSKGLKKGKRFNLIALGDENDNLRYIAVFKQFLKTTGTENCFLNAKLEYSNYLTINDRILSDTEHVAYINCFNKYDLIARKFVETHPITRYLDGDFIDFDKACLKEGVNVNVTYFGFGKIAKALFRNSVMNDQIPALDGKTLKPYVINYCAYELIERGDENQNAQFFDNRYTHAKSEMAQGDYFPLPEKIFNFEFINKDINHVDCFNEFKAKLLSCDKHFNEIIISYGEDADNINLALNLVSLFKQRGYNDYHVFVRVRTYREEYKAFFDQAKVTFFGYDDFIINHDVLVDESLAIKATAIHDSYENKRSKIAKWTKAPAIKKMSNVYAAMNARLKLNLLGYDADWGKSTADDIAMLDEITKKLLTGAPKEKDEYKNYLFWEKDGFSVANALAYQEKMRWNAFYIMNGYAPMKKSDIYARDDGSVYKDDDDKKLHGCITTVKGLDDYHKYVAKLVADKTGEEYAQVLEDTQTYKYDYSFAYVLNTYKQNGNVNVKKKA